MKEKNVIVIVDGKKLHLTFGKTYADYCYEGFDQDDDLWDFPIEELLDGTVEINENVYYWCINGRCFETDIVM